MEGDLFFQDLNAFILLTQTDFCIIALIVSMVSVFILAFEYVIYTLGRGRKRKPPTGPPRRSKRLRRASLDSGYATLTDEEEDSNNSQSEEDNVSSNDQSESASNNETDSTETDTDSDEEDSSSSTDPMLICDNERCRTRVDEQYRYHPERHIWSHDQDPGWGAGEIELDDNIDPEYGEPSDFVDDTTSFIEILEDVLNIPFWITVSESNTIIFPGKEYKVI